MELRFSHQEATQGARLPPPAAPPNPTHFAKAPSGSAKSMAAVGPNSFCRWHETNCCFSPSSCRAKAMGVSSSSAADSFTALCVKRGGGGAGSVLSPAPCATPQVYLSPPRSVCQPPPSQSQSRCCDTAHLDLLHITDQLLHLVLQPLVPLLGGLLGTQPLSQLQGETGTGGSQSG